MIVSHSSPHGSPVELSSSHDGEVAQRFGRFTTQSLTQYRLHIFTGGVLGKNTHVGEKLQQTVK
jgi:hypothetical protein